MFEEEIGRNPYALKPWVRHLAQQSAAAPRARAALYERALLHLPRSYKLWHAYLSERLEQVKGAPPASTRNEALLRVFERALSHMNKMPRIWCAHPLTPITPPPPPHPVCRQLYLSFVVTLRRGTFTRKAFDRALQALPITQHDHVWGLFVQWARDFGVVDTAVRVFRRFLMYDPAQREDLVEFLSEHAQHAEAARQLVACLEDDGFRSASGKTKHELWMRLCDLCALHPNEVRGVLDVERVLRSGIARFSDEVGRLWTRLADYYIRLGEFERARDVLEEALGAVVTVRDFSVVFDAYVKFEESLLSAKMRLEEDEAELAFDLARLEHLVDKRPLLLNQVMLRQNPSNVHEWVKRVRLMQDDPRQTVLTYMEAVRTVDPALCTGKLSSLWLGLAHYYERHKDLANARAVMRQGTEARYRSVDELALVWCSWAEMELRHKNYSGAMEVMLQAVRDPSGSAEYRRRRAAAEGGAKDDLSAPLRLHRNLKVWSLYLDLEESLGTVESCSSAYDRAMELKVVTPQMALNYAAYLEEHDYFENSFRVYERAVLLFEWPHVKPIWLRYIDQFMARYGGTKLERLRDLFEQAVSRVPPEHAGELYVRYGKAEEQHGLARHAMAVYDRATRAVPETQRLDAFRLYAAKVEEHYGVTRTRPVYERALRELGDDECRALALEFSDMERKLGEVDRARVRLRSLYMCWLMLMLCCRRSTNTPRSSRTRASTRTTGEAGASSKRRTATRTPSETCCACSGRWRRRTRR